MERAARLRPLLLLPLRGLLLQRSRLARCVHNTTVTAAPRRESVLPTTAAAATAAPSRRSVHHQRQEFLKLEPALRAFRARHGHVAVPLRFSIPAQPSDNTFTANKGSSSSSDANSSDATGRESESKWPEELQGMKLGTALSRFLKVAQKPENAAIAAQLTALGVPVEAVGGDWKRYLWEQIAVAALQTYRALHGHFFVPYAFQVPHGDAQWPRQTWGYKLGYWVVELRRDKSRLEAYQLRDLRAMRFVWSAREARWNQFFVPAMQTFAALHGARARVPQSFVVPSDDPRWPRELHGYRLGQKVNNLRCGDSSTRSLDADDNDSSSRGGARGDDEWDDVELVYNNWVLLDLLHENDEGDSVTSTESGDAPAESDAVETQEMQRAAQPAHE